MKFGKKNNVNFRIEDAISMMSRKPTGKMVKYYILKYVEYQLILY